MVTVIMEPGGKEREVEYCKSVRAVLNRLGFRQNETLTILETADGPQLVTWDVILEEGARLRIRPVTSRG
ncbi:hypothetical protein [Megalodesulfovibrio gigas]|uniref:Thiamine biosynthesis protein ThiS n=1 Tax=Megalodesulfovibrio gigas (strain ATCC 19364 / DSM 1382 / NCIMB 9332 / VKM B-1759) TaxID=1121448 RepID=T2G883_MEGG1|nr:hypothetical protein [Megalodesulfovibrio gigas]AGW12356.1 hypothetical protein DGI_0442 [Megalodesulfovibrio gigas DSM 1382 = ATCC 19364]